MSIPAHKVVGDVGKPGQITLARRYLEDYIARKTDEPKRVIFAEWYPINKNKIGYNYDEAQLIWNAALKEGKL